MLYINRLLSLMVVALLLSACQPIVRMEPQAPQGLRPDAPLYGIRGPYPVGARDYMIPTGAETVPITVWYPALNPSQAKERIVYQVNDQLPRVAGLPAEALHIDGRALANAKPDMAGAPYPLMIFSPGLGAFRQANSYLVEHLASYGFVVIAADTRGESGEEFWLGMATRILDTKAAIAYADQLTAATGELAGLIDTEHIATAGHSSGGWAALAGAGAQFDFGWCTANAAIVAENPLSNCPQFMGHQTEIAAMLGLDAAPTGMWPPLNDPRVDAVISFAGDGDIWGANYEGIAALTVPALIMTGENDILNIPERTAYPIYEHLSSANKSLVVFERGNHMIFIDQCSDSPVLLAMSHWFCSDEVWDMARAHDLTDHFVTAFLLAELKGDSEAANALAPENVAFPGIQYETTAFGQ